MQNRNSKVGLLSSRNGINKMKKVDKSSSAGTKNDSSTNVDSLQVCQPIAKPNVGGSTDKQDCSRHKKDVAGISDMKILAEMIGNLHYESLTKFLGSLSEKLSIDGHKDEAAGRNKLSNQLYHIAGYISKASIHSNWAWKISQPFMSRNEGK